MKKINKKTIILIIYLIPISVLIYHCLINNFSSDVFLEYKDQFTAFKHTHLILFFMIFLIIYSTLITFSLPFNVIMNLFAGYLFGPLTGALFASIAISFGSYLLFLISRSSTQKFHNKYSNLKIFKTKDQNIILTLFFLRLSPLFPAPVITIGCGLANIKDHIFIITTFLGSIPLVLIYTLIGSHLDLINHTRDIYNSNVIILLLSLTLISLSPLLKHDIRKMTGIKKIQRLFVFFK